MKISGNRGSEQFLLLHSDQKVSNSGSNTLHPAKVGTSLMLWLLVLLYLPFQIIFSEPSLCLCTLDCRSEGLWHGCEHSEHHWGKCTRLWAEGFVEQQGWGTREGNGTPLQYSCLENPCTEEPDRLQSTQSLRVRYNWATSLSLFTFMHWKRKWQPPPVFLPGESQGWGSLVGCRLWSRTESDTTEAT